MTASSVPIRANETAKGPQATSLRILVGFAIALAVVGAVIAALLLTQGGPGTAVNVVGQPVDTSFGAFTVTNVKTTFVPDTQGPPTAAQHAGTNGSQQLQVWVRLVNDRAEPGLAYAPAQVRLVTDAPSGKGQSPDGSSIQATLLPPGGVIDGQVWFDLPKVRKSTGAGWFLEYKDPGGDPVRVAIDTPQALPSQAAPPPSGGAGGGDSHPHDDSAGKH